MAQDHDGHDSHVRNYLILFGVLTALTVVEMLPLFGLVMFPAPLLLSLSAVKFVLVVLFFMHLWGDAALNWRVFFIPLGMAGGSVAILMALFGTWSLQYQETARGRDSDEVAARYRSRWDGPCNNWVNSPLTGNEYCTSPAIGFSTQAAYDALKVKVVDPLFEGFDAKGDEERKAVLMAAGEKVYAANCTACHQANGAGLPPAFPPLAADPIANGGDADEHVKIILNGLSGKVIGGVAYATAMQPWRDVLSDEQIAAVVTYERNSWGNVGSVVEPKQVAGLR